MVATPYIEKKIKNYKTGKNKIRHKKKNATKQDVPCFKKHLIILPTQYEFRSNHSISHALIDLLTTCYDNINDNNYTSPVLLDFKKAFDTVNDKINKPDNYGVCGVALGLFFSFLSNRFQYVSLENQQSSLKNINCGVPQGSVLAPLLFTVYINEINNIISSGPRLFADETCLILQNKSLCQLHKK